MSTTLRNVVGQSLMLCFNGTEVTDEVLVALGRTRAGGVILFARNISSPRQVYDLNRALQAHAAAIGLPPLLISIDQEGGIVSRLPTPFVTVPSPMAQAATGGLNFAEECALITGQQLRSVGINTNFAPVLDVNNNPTNPVIGTRSFGEQAAAVTAFGQAALRGYTAASVVPVVKHFPGHGDTSVDSHIGLPMVAHDQQRLNDVELAPFRAAFVAGAPAVMTAHIIFEALDQQPATLSRSILTNLLRDDLGFDGVIFTDALDMKAIADRFGPTDAARRAKAAGADVILPLGSLDEQIAVVDAMCAAVESEELPLSVFEATARRLDILRSAYSISHELPPFTELEPGLYNRALDVARRSITVIGRSDALPLAGQTRLVLIDCLLPRFSLVEEAYARAESLSELISRAFPQMVGLTVGAEPTDEDVSRALALLRDADAVLLITRNAILSPLRTSFVQALMTSSIPVIHVAVGLPYDAGLVMNAATTILTYGDPDVSLTALVDVLTGRVTAQGLSPITLNVSRQDAAS